MSPGLDRGYCWQVRDLLGRFGAESVKEGICLALQEFGAEEADWITTLEGMPPDTVSALIQAVRSQAMEAQEAADAQMAADEEAQQAEPQPPQEPQESQEQTQEDAVSPNPHVLSEGVSDRLRMDRTCKRRSGCRVKTAVGSRRHRRHQRPRTSRIPS